MPPTIQEPATQQSPTDETNYETAADPPTETMPAVTLPDRGADPDRTPDEVVLAPPLPPPATAGASRRRRRNGLGELLAGGLLGVLAALTLIVGVIVAGNLGMLGGGDVAGNDASPAAAPTDVEENVEENDEATAEPTDAAPEADGSYSCDPQRVTAPGGGRWLLYRASYGTRAERDVFVLQLRRDGGADEVAGITAELLPADEVPGRYGLDAPPDAEAALVLVLEGPIRVAGPFGDRPGYRTLQRFQVVQGGGTVHAVLSLRSNGCFAMSAADWQAGEMPNQTQVTIEIENR